MTKTLILVALGGALGALLRFGTSVALGFGLGTLAVNVAGSFAIGLMFPLLLASHPAWAFGALGLLGSFTTFSTFSLDTLRLIEDGRVGMAAGYVAASLLLSLGACAAGWALGRTLA